MFLFIVHKFSWAERFTKFVLCILLSHGKVERMNKKKKKIIRISIILAVVVAILLIVLISRGNRKVGAKQFVVENVDEMEFDPFLSTENRLDNSLLEYGKVLTKYRQKGYTDY